MARERQRRVFRYEIHRARLDLAQKYSAILLRVLLINQPEAGSLRYEISYLYRIDEQNSELVIFNFFQI